MLIYLNMFFFHRLSMTFCFLGCKGDSEVLKKYCSKEIIERCKAEHQAFDSQGIIFDNKVKQMHVMALASSLNIYLH